MKVAIFCSLYNKWGACDEVLSLIAARFTYLMGQHGSDDFDYFTIPEDRFEAFFDRYVEGTIKSKEAYKSDEIFKALKHADKICSLFKKFYREERFLTPNFDQSNKPCYAEVID